MNHRADFLSGKSGGVECAHDGADAGCGYAMRADAQFVERFKHLNMGQPAGPAAAQRQPDLPNLRFSAQPFHEQAADQSSLRLIRLQ